MNPSRTIIDTRTVKARIHAIEHTHNTANNSNQTCTLLKKNTQLTIKIANFTREVRENIKTITDLTKENHTLKENLKTMTQKAAAQAIKIQKHGKKENDDTQKITGLEKENYALKEKLKTMTQEAKAKANETNTLHKKENDHTQKITDLTQKNNTLQKKLTTMTQESNAQAIKNHALKGQLDHLHEINKKNITIHTLRSTQHRKDQSQIKRLKTICLDLQHAFDYQNQRITNLRHELDNKNQRIHNLEQKNPLSFLVTSCDETCTPYDDAR
jgi:hypothetical protein